MPVASCQLSGKWYTLIVDETTYLSNVEQMVLCLRYVDSSFEVHEELIGLKVMKDTLDTVYEIKKLIKKSPKRDVIFQKIKSEISSESPGVR